MSIRANYLAETHVFTEFVYKSCSLSSQLSTSGCISTNEFSVPFAFSSTSHMPSTEPLTHSTSATATTNEITSSRASSQSTSSVPSFTACVRAVARSISCPADNGTLYTPPSKRLRWLYQYLQDTLWRGCRGSRALPTRFVANATACIRKCDENAACFVIAYEPTTQQCYEQQSYERGSFTLVDLTGKTNLVLAYRARLTKSIRRAQARCPHLQIGHLRARPPRMGFS